MTASSAAAADAPADEAALSAHDLQRPVVAASPPRGVPDVVAGGVLAVVVGAMAALMYAAHRTGHWWGDDWALYIRQAKGLLDGHPNRVLTENEFTVTHSLGPEFSPPLYPWGFPLLLAPFIAVVGDDVDRLMIVPVLCACVFAVCWYALARRRLGFVPAVVGVVAVTITPLLLSWSELIQSEWPFLAASGVALVILDRVARSDDLVEGARRWWPLVLVGVGAAAAFTVRREGLAMVGAIGVAQLAALWQMRPRPWRLRGSEMARLVGRLAIPHATFLVVVGTLQAALPSTVVPKYNGTSIWNVWRLRGRLVRNLAQVSGMQRPWDKNPMVLGSVTAGWVAVAAYLVFAVAGVGMAVAVHRRRDLHLAGYALGAYLIGGSFRSPINRYVSTVAPIVMLFALVALAALVRRIGPRWVASAAVTVVLAAIVAGNIANAHLRVQSANRTRAVNAIEWGPTHPDAQAMFAEVRALTDPDDIVAAPKARAMVLETGRPSIQVDSYRPIPTDLDIALIVVERSQDPKVDDQLVTDPGYELVWQNARFDIFRPR